MTLMAIERQLTLKVLMMNHKL